MFGRTFAEMRADAADAAAQTVRAAAEAARREQRRLAAQRMHEREQAQLRLLNLQGSILGTGLPGRDVRLIASAEAEQEEALGIIGSGRRRGPGGLSEAALRQLFRIMAEEFMGQFNPTITLDDGTIAGRVSNRINERSALLSQTGGGIV